MTSSDANRVNIHHGNIDPATFDLADLAGLKGPGNTMRIYVELILMGVPPREVHQLVREILANKFRTRRASASASTRASSKTTSRRSVTSEAIQENTAPPS